MKLSKIIKMPIVSLYLGMIFSGMAVFATENKDNQNNLENITQSQEIVSKIDGNKETEELIKKEVDAGKSETYAKEYAKMKVEFKMEEDEARKCATLFESIIKKGRSEVYAEEYVMLVAKFIIKTKENVSYKLFLGNFVPSYNSKERFMLGLWFENMELKWLNMWVSIVENEIQTGKSLTYAREYARLTLGCRLDESFARKYADTFDKEVKSGKSEVYATEYARLVNDYGDEVARKHAEIVDKEFESGKSYVYASRYATMIVDCKAEESVARNYAKVYEEENTIKKYVNYDDRDLGIYVYQNEFDSFLELCRGIAHYRPKYRDLELKEGAVYESEYKKLTEWYNVEENRAEKLATIVEQEHKKGHSYIYAEEYARLKAECNVSETDARRYSETLEKEIKIKEEFKYFGGKYVELMNDFIDKTHLNDFIKKIQSIFLKKHEK